MSSEIATIDFETRNVTDSKLLFQHGAWNYSRHPATKILCIAYKLPTNDNVKYWYCAESFRLNLKKMDPPQDLLDYVEAGGLIEAHNVFFERCIWTHVAIPMLKWPEVAPSQWRCSMAKALTHAIPKSLDDAGKAMKLNNKKSEEGHRLMLLMTSSYHYDNVANIKKLIAYCIQDVKTEMELSETLTPMSDFEIEVWQEDLEMNWRGVHIDMTLVDKALKHIEYYSELVNNRFHHLIGVPRTTMRARVRDWFASTGQPIDNTQKEYLQALHANPPKSWTPKHKEAVRLMLANNLSSLAKYKKVTQYIDRLDNRLRSNTIYHGGHLGRYTSVGVQLHNFVRETVPHVEEMADFAATDSSKDFALRAKPLGGVSTVLSKLLRTMIVPSDREHMKLIVSDYAAIEARILFWLAGEVEALRILAAGEDIYCALASRIFRTTISKSDKMERQLGKQAILGLGYGMGWYTFLQTLRKYGIFLSPQECKDILGNQYNDYYMTIAKDTNYNVDPSDRPEGALCKFVVDIYRATYLAVIAFWKSLERDAIYACGNFRYQKPFLRYRLKSGKDIMYPYPKRQKTTTPWGEDRYEFTAALVHGSKFYRVGFYGGKLAENVVQATAREILVRAIINVRHHDNYQMVHHAHDEIVAESYNPVISEFDKMMLDVGPEFEGCPLAVETHICNRWQKF